MDREPLYNVFSVWDGKSVTLGTNCTEEQAGKLMKAARLLDRNSDIYATAWNPGEQAMDILRPVRALDGSWRLAKNV